MYLILGASGFIGRHLYAYCRKNDIEVLGTYYTHSDNPEWIRFDICKDNLGEICGRYARDRVVDSVVVCGANASIDDCKRNVRDSNELNVYGTKRIISQADALGIKIVFLSSEAVFDGRRGMYTEEDIPNPVTLYGCQKLLTEQYITENLENYLIFRISRAVGSSFGEKDIFDEFYNKIRNSEEIVCLKNQSFCVTEVDDIAEVIVRSLQKGLSGLFHLSSSNYISRYEPARLYADRVFNGYDKITEKEYADIPFLDGRHVLGGLKGDRLAAVSGICYKSTTEIMNRYIRTKNEATNTI